MKHLRYAPAGGAAVLAVWCLSAVTPAWSAATVTESPKLIEEVVSVGSRGQPRSAVNSLAPVDFITAERFVRQGGYDTSDLLRNLSPSYNVNDQPISDAATLVRPANMRGLGPDHHLVLVNGQRRHRSSVISWVGNGVADGAQGPDISAIPALALRSVEVLRDGAGAQYGSDAIAGVVNFNLKNSSSEGAFVVKYGEYAEGDGEQVNVAVNKGFPLGERGFVNVTAEWAEVGATDRSVLRDDAAALSTAGYTQMPEPAQIWGLPDVDDDYKLWVNFGADLVDGVELFGTANYNNKEAAGGFFFRNPTSRSGVYGIDDGRALLIGDLTPGPVGQDNSAYPALGTGDGLNCPEVLVQPDLTPEPVAFAQVLADPNCFSFQEVIPGGFRPRFGGEVTDASLLLGLRGTLDNGFHWQVTGYRGQQESDFFIDRTVNASFGPLTRRNFDPGAYEQEETNFNADFSWPLGSEVNLGFGAEYREETFIITAGESDSYADGGLGAQGFSTSTNGFPGFSPQISGSFDRSNLAAYADLEWQPTEALLLGIALRHEDFEDFGSTTSFRLGANLAVNEHLGVRATAGTGFKAPTPGQSNASNISTRGIGALLVNQGVIPSTSPVAMLRGGGQLDPERATSYTLGAYFTAGPFDVTLDYFRIEMDDRLNLSNEFVLTDTERALLLGRGIDASDIAEFRFFTNQFDTETQGVDLVVHTGFDWTAGHTALELAFSYADTEVSKRDPALLDDTRVRRVEDGVPATRWNFTADHTLDRWRFLFRLSFYGDYYDGDAGGEFDEAYVYDLELGYTLTEQIDISFGGRNVGDEKGCHVNRCGSGNAGINGMPYSEYTPWGFSGTFYYGQVIYNFN